MILNYLPTYTKPVILNLNALCLGGIGKGRCSNITCSVF